MDLLIVFRFRGDAVRFAAALRKNGIAAATISTPQRYGKPCGLSVTISSSTKEKALHLLNLEGLTQGIERMERV